MGTFNHNKKRNSGLVYEFFVRHLSKAMIDKDVPNYQKSLGLIRKYFGPSTPLAEERELFDVVRNTRGVSENAARRILGEVQRAAAHADQKKIDIKKSNLIKEVNYGFGQNFWDQHRVPEYRLLATIQMIIDTARVGKIQLTESVQEIQLEEGLVKYMMSDNEYSVVPARNEDVDTLVMALTAKKFQEKYSKHLSSNQKVLLEKYMRSQVTGDEQQLLSFINEETKRLEKSMSKAFNMKEIQDDAVMKQKLTEAYAHLTRAGNRQLDEVVEDIMLFQNLVEEIESDG